MTLEQWELERSRVWREAVRLALDSQARGFQVFLGQEECSASEFARRLTAEWELDFPKPRPVWVPFGGAS